MRTLLCLPVLLLAPAFLVQEATQEAPYVCPPCGAQCHQDLYPRPGNCANCGMGLVPRASVPHVAVLLYPGVDLVTATLPLGVLASSDAALVYTVADTTDPLRIGDTLEVTPQYSFEDAPLPDLLVVPSMWGAHEDELVMRWVAQAVERADHVLSIGLGNVVIAKTGRIDGARVPLWSWARERGAEAVSGVELVSEPVLVEHGKFRLARDAAAGLECALGLVRELSDEGRADRTAERLGFERLLALGEAR